MQTETLAIRLSKAERNALRLAAKKGKVSQGQLVRHALRAYGIGPKDAPAPNAFELVKHLIGRQSGGPDDLSTNPRHLEGFGR